MIHVIATIEVAEGASEGLLNELHSLVPRVYAEAGCVEYTPYVDFETSIPAQGGARTNVVTVLEKWKDLAALETHLKAPHMEEYRAKVKDLVKSVRLTILKSV